MRSKLGLAAETLAAIQLGYAQKGQSLAQAALCGAAHFVEWQHYPRNDVTDANSGYEFYYHAHATDVTECAEHGHFHVFRRDATDQSHFTHLVAISLNQTGIPVRIFTTNQWVTGEQFQWADRVMDNIRDFHLCTKGRMVPIANWLGAFLQLFESEIEQIVLARDLKIAQLSEEDELSNVLESRRYHILTQCNIDLFSRLELYGSGASEE
jgi:hypothetical protein